MVAVIDWEERPSRGPTAGAAAAAAAAAADAATRLAVDRPLLLLRGSGGRRFTVACSGGGGGGAAAARLLLRLARVGDIVQHVAHPLPQLLQGSHELFQGGPWLPPCLWLRRRRRCCRRRRRCRRRTGVRLRRCLCRCCCCLLACLSWLAAGGSLHSAGATTRHHSRTVAPPVLLRRILVCRRRLFQRACQPGASWLLAAAAAILAAAALGWLLGGGAGRARRLRLAGRLAGTVTASLLSASLLGGALLALLASAPLPNVSLPLHSQRALRVQAGAPALLLAAGPRGQLGGRRRDLSHTWKAQKGTGTQGLKGWTPLGSSRQLSIASLPRCVVLVAGYPLSTPRPPRCTAHLVQAHAVLQPVLPVVAGQVQRRRQRDVRHVTAAVHVLQ